MRGPLVRAIGLALIGFFALASCAQALDADSFCGVWLDKDVAVDIWREDGEIRCNAVFIRAAGERERWEYSACWLDEDEGALMCGGVARTREAYDHLWEEWTESDWSMDDLSFARFEITEPGPFLLWSDDGMETTLSLWRLEDARE